MQEKIMEFKTADEILDYAIQSEEGAYAFYTAWSKRVENKGLVKLFEELADEETGHKEFLLEVKKGAVMEPSEKEITDLRISDYMVEPTVSNDMDYQDALTLAMKREKEAFKLYSKLAEMATDGQMQDTFKALAQEEAKHKLRLELIYDEDILQEN